MDDVQAMSCPNCSHILDFSEDPATHTENQTFRELDAARTKRKNDDIVKDQMDAKIGQMDHFIDSLLRQRAAVSRSRNRYAPVACLPVEILSEIFRWTFHMSGQDITSCARPTTLPLVLGQVCSEWRNIAWGLSELWDTFHFCISQYKMVVQEALLKEWIARSGNRLLSIRISLRHFAWDYTADGQTHIIDALIPHCRRWKSIDLTFPEPWYEPLEGVKGMLDNLVCLKIRPPGNVFILKSLNSFSDAPLLQSITSSQYYLHDLELPWTQLTTGIFRTASLDEAVQILSRCPNLVTCRFDDLTDVEGHFPLEIVTHKNIQQLTVTLNTYTYIAPFLDLLVLPSLSFLGVVLPDFHPAPLYIIQILIERSQCPLKAIRIIGVHIDSSEIIDFLTCNPGVLNINNEPSLDNLDPSTL